MTGKVRREWETITRELIKKQIVMTSLLGLQWVVLALDAGKPCVWFIVKNLVI